jgi:hypothetical protein
MWAGLLLTAGGLFSLKYLFDISDYLVKRFGGIAVDIILNLLVAIGATYYAINYKYYMDVAMEVCNQGSLGSCLTKDALECFELGSVWTIPVLLWIKLLISFMVLQNFGTGKK